MALSAGRLADALRAAMLFDESIAAIDGSALTAFCNAVAEAVVAEITNHAEAVVGGETGTVE